MGIAANAMRQILVERARAQRAAKRGGAAHQVTLDEAMLPGGVRPIDIEALDEALARLEAHNPELARIVELRFFGGLTVEETADQLDSSPATIKRRWTLAKAWLLRELGGRQSDLTDVLGAGQERDDSLRRAMTRWREMSNVPDPAASRLTDIFMRVLQAEPARREGLIRELCGGRCSLARATSRSWSPRPNARRARRG